MPQENGVMPGLYSSISQPNLATAVSPTPQTPNGNTDLNLEQSFDQNNDLSFEDESVVKVEGMVWKIVLYNFLDEAKHDIKNYSDRLIIVNRRSEAE